MRRATRILLVGGLASAAMACSSSSSTVRDDGGAAGDGGASTDTAATDGEGAADGDAGEAETAGGDAPTSDGASGADGGDSADTTGGDAGEVATDGCTGTMQEVSFETSDGVELVADHVPAPVDDVEQAPGAVVLLHMIPPANDRTNYPDRIVADLADSLGVTVLNVDRRGAGDSEGEPQNAYEGPKGKLDVEAAVRFLLADERACPVAPDRIALVGASNGTTSTLDYTVAREDESLPDPAALAWLSPGDYTVEQHPVADHRSLLDTIPILWVHPDDEPWSTQFEEGAPDVWRFIPIEGGQHGTGNFDDGELEEAFYPEMKSWLEPRVGGG